MQLVLLPLLIAASSNINCPLKVEDQIKEKSHGTRAIIGSSENQKRNEETMGRKQLTVQRHCRGSHFTWSERLMLQYYYCGSNGYAKERSLALIFFIF